MPEWKQLITSGSDATLGDVTASSVSASDATFGTLTIDGESISPSSTTIYRQTQTSSATAGPGWITVATNTSARRHGEVFVSDSESGDHAFIRIDWLRSYRDSNFSVLQVGGHSNRITGVRVLTEDANNTYGVKYLQVYATAESNYGVRIMTLGSPKGYTSHTAVSPTVEYTISGYSVQGNILTDLDDVSLAAEQGITAGGPISASGDITGANLKTANGINLIDDTTNMCQIIPQISNAGADIIFNGELGGRLYHTSDSNRSIKIQDDAIDGIKIKSNSSYVSLSDNLVLINGTRILTDGKVGIGNASPVTKLHVVHASDPNNVPELGDPPSAASIGGTDYGTLFTTLSSGAGIIQQARTDGIGGAFDLLLQPKGGKVGIGTSSPAANLHISAGTTGDATVIIEADTDNTSGQEDNNPSILFKQDNSTVRAQIGIEGNAGNTFTNTISNAAYFGTSTSQVVQFIQNSIVRTTIDTSGRLGIGTNSPSAFLHVMKTNGNARDGIRIQKIGSTYWDIYPNSTGHLYFNFYGGSYGGYIANNSPVNQITFTGQHRNLPSSGSISDYDSSIGLIVIADGTYANFANSVLGKPNINESLPKVALSDTSNDKRVFGVISDSEDSGNTREFYQGSFVSTYEKEDSDTRLIINSLGEGAVWVSNYSGSLQNGDYITSSPISGLGMKQDDDLLHNYTVAKITQDCNFRINSTKYDCVEFEYSGSTYRKAFVGCTYHCG
tara:strand:- start:814 stop:3000 length:2187 start_codon:yes stop_codon:yes gene_type:complete